MIDLAYFASRIAYKYFNGGSWIDYLTPLDLAFLDDAWYLLNMDIRNNRGYQIEYFQDGTIRTQSEEAARAMENFFLPLVTPNP